MALAMACGGKAETTASGGSTSSTGSGQSGSPCTKDAGCPQGQGCLYSDAACTKGTCHPLNMSDCGPGSPMCHCDGTVDAHACGMPVSGARFTTDTGCFPKTFACGMLMCMRGQQSCASSFGPMGESMHACVALPAECQVANASCDCFKLGQGCSCSKDGYGNFSTGCSG